MKNSSEKRTVLLTTLVCLVPVLIGAILYKQLPETIVTHWDGHGNPNGWQPKLIGVIVYPGILVLINLLFPFLLRIDPKYVNLDRKLKTLVQWIIPVVSMFASGTTLASAIGKEVPVILFGTLLLGVLFIAIGNYLPKTKQSYTVGIRIPWTLNSEENWNKTHRMAGFVWVIGGFLMLIAGIFGFGMVSVPVIMIILVILPTVYSYLLFRKGI